MGVTLPTALETLKALARASYHPTTSSIVNLTEYCKNKDVPDLASFEGNCRGCRILQFYLDSPTTTESDRVQMESTGKPPWPCYNGAKHPDIIFCESEDRRIRGEHIRVGQGGIADLHYFIRGEEPPDWEQLRKEKAAKAKLAEASAP